MSKSWAIGSIIFGVIFLIRSSSKASFSGELNEPWQGVFVGLILFLLGLFMLCRKSNNNK